MFFGQNWTILDFVGFFLTFVDKIGQCPEMSTQQVKIYPEMSNKSCRDI